MSLALKAVGWGWATWLVLAACQTAHADGGTIRLFETRGDYRISVLTAPNPFRAGPVEISVLVQDAATGEPFPDAKVGVQVVPRRHSENRTAQSAQEFAEIRRYPATTDSATNKLFHSATFELPAAGWWDFEVNVAGKHGAAKVSFDMEAAERLPNWRRMWPWFSWPLLAVALFAVHRALAFNRTPLRPRPAPGRPGPLRRE